MANGLNTGGSPGRSSPGKSIRPGHRQGRFSRGRMWLILIFFIFRAIDLIVYFGISTGSQRTVGIILVSAIWSTALLAGIWQRLNWARAVLIAFQIFDIVLTAIALINVQIIRQNYHAMRMPLIAIALRGVIMWILIASADIRRLCSRRDG